MAEHDATVTRTIHADADRVWKVSTDSDLMSEWMMRARVESTWQPGASITWSGEFTDHLNKVEKFVLSSTMNDPEWENSTVLECRTTPPPDGSIRFDKDYSFKESDRTRSLVDLFAGREQLIVYHFWFEPGEEPCAGCSLWAQ